MTAHHTYTSAARTTIIEALEVAHGELEKAAAFADHFYHHDRAVTCRKAADRCVLALLRLDREDNNVIPIGGEA